MNSGFDEVSRSDGVIEEGTILFFAAMNETQGGEIAASRFVESNTLTNYTELNALFISSVTTGITPGLSTLSMVQIMSSGGRSIYPHLMDLMRNFQAAIINMS